MASPVHTGTAHPSPPHHGPVPLWEVVKWLGLPALALAVAWGYNQANQKSMATREEVAAIRLSQEAQSKQMTLLLQQVSRLTCRLYPQSYECPDHAVDPSVIPSPPTISNRGPR
jgi:hypothetical protein